MSNQNNNTPTSQKGKDDKKATAKEKASKKIGTAANILDIINAIFGGKKGG